MVYLEHNLEYAQEVVKLALTSGDAELHRLGSRLDAVLSHGTAPTQIASVKFVAPVSAMTPVLEDLPSPAQKEEVPHHYIGALR